MSSKRTDGDCEDSDQSEGSYAEELKAKVKELEGRVEKLNSENARLKKELRFTMQHQRRMSDEKVDSLKHEVELLSSRNEKFSAELIQTEADLQNVKHAKIQLDAEFSANMTAQSKALVERLAVTRQEMDKQRQTELSKALKWRETLVRRLKDMDINIEDILGDEEAVESSLPDKSMQELLESLRSSRGSVSLLKTGTQLVQRVAGLKEENRRQIQEQIDLLRQEIEDAMSRKRALENEIEHLRRKLDMIQTEFKIVDRQRVKTLQSQLQAAIKEKDQWEKKAKKFEDTLDSLKLVYSLQRHLSKEEEIKAQYEKELQRCHTEQLVMANRLEEALQESQTAIHERNEVIRERNSLAIQAQQEYERAERLQRLVVVLRKKAAQRPGSAKSPSNDV